MSELAEALRDLDEVKKNRNELNKENKDLREKIENVEKERENRMRMLQRAAGHSHSRDSAIDTDLQVGLFPFPGNTLLDIKAWQTLS